MTHPDPIARAAEAIRQATALVITAGAGMGVDSGLPDFRGPEGFWRAYPPFRALGLRFEELANPRWFVSDPTLAWGFYGHRLNLYRRTAPHRGFDLVLRWARQMRDGWVVFTSNVDGHFQRAGFDPERVHECHGAIDSLQCTRSCGAGIFAAPACEVAVDESTFRARPPLPACPACGALARPNVLMFGDWGWDSGRSDAQEARLSEWCADLRRASAGRCVVVECGAGTRVPTVRLFGEGLTRALGATLVRINRDEPAVPAGQIAVAAGALAAIEAIDALLNASRASLV